MNEVEVLKGREYLIFPFNSGPNQAARIIVYPKTGEIIIPQAFAPFNLLGLVQVEQALARAKQILQKEADRIANGGQ